MKSSVTEEERNRIIFEDLPVRKALTTMAVPLIISQLVVLLYNIADVYFIGRTNNPYMIAAASLVLPVYNLSFVFSNIASVGGGTLVSRLLGAGETYQARRVCSFSIGFSLISSLLFALFTYILMKPVLLVLGASSQTYEFARQYALCVVVVGGVPTIMSLTLGNMLRNVGNSRITGFGFSMAGIINMILDPIFMFVILPEGKEVIGAGIATAISNVIACIFFISYIKKIKSEVIRFSFKEEMPSKDQIESIFSVGIPAAINSLMFDVDYMLIDKFMSMYSDTALAAVGIVLKAERLPLNVCVGICNSMVPLVAYNYASGNRLRMSDIVKTARKAGILFSIFALSLNLIFAKYIIRFFIADPETVRLGTNFLRARTLASPFMFMCFTHAHFFQAVGRGDQAFKLIFLRWIICNFALMFILNTVIGMYGVVLTQVIGDFICAMISIIVYNKYIKTIDLQSSTQALP